MKTSKTKPMYTTLGWASIGLCGLCCALPIIGAVAGIGSLAVLGLYLEKIGIVALGIAGILFAFHAYNKHKAKTECVDSCDIDCACQTEGVTK